MISALANAVLPLLLAATADAGSLAPTVRIEPDTIRADDEGRWSIPLTVHNPGQFGLYGDSLIVEVTDLDPGVSRTPRHSTLSYASLVIRGASPFAAGEDRPMPLSLAATSERARIVLSIGMHAGGSDGARYVFRESLLALPGTLTASLPSSFLSVKGKRVEIVIATATGGAPTAAPGVLLVPAETAHARRMLGTAARLAARGMNVVVVSPPGYGQSDGPADMAGPDTYAALQAALAKLASLPGTDRSRLAVWGTGRGATAALLLAARHPEIVKLVAQDAGYDLWTSWRCADAATAADIAAEAGPDSAGWRARSPLRIPFDSKPGMLVIQGPEPEAAARATRAFVAARLAAGAGVDTLYASGATRRFPRDPFRAATVFLGPPAQK